MNNPFPQKQSLIYQVFAMAMRGTTIKKITDFAKRKGGNGSRLIRILRLGEWNGRKWTIEEGNNGTIKVVPSTEKIIPKRLREVPTDKQQTS